jgi:hypothetical protein
MILIASEHLGQTGGAEVPSLAGEGEKNLVLALLALDPGKTVS